MSTVVPPAVALLLPPTPWEVDVAATTVGEASARPSEVGPQEDSQGRMPSLALAASGRLAPPTTTGAGEDLRIRTHWPGYLGEAAYVWRHERHLGVVASGDYYGCDVPPAITVHRGGGWDSDAAVRQDPSAVATPDGTIVTASSYRTTSGSGAWSVRVRRWSTSTGTWSADITVVGGLADVDTAPSPCLVYLDEPDDPSIDGVILCAYWYVDATLELASIRWSVSRDSGATWSVWARETLDASIDVSASGYLPGRIVAAYRQGQLGVWAEVADPNAGASESQIWQWASADLGRTLTLVAGADDTVLAAARPSVVIQADRWWLAIARQVDSGGSAAVVRGYVYEMGSPYTSWRSVTARQIGDGVQIGVAASGAITDGEIVLCPWPVSRLLCLHSIYLSTGPVRLRAGGTYLAPLDPSTTATTFAEVQLPNGWWDDGQGGAGAATEWPIRMALVRSLAAGRLLCQVESAGTQYEAQWTDLQLGGWSSITHPRDASDLLLTEGDLDPWASTTIASVSPASQGWTGTGAGTLSITATPGSFRLTTAAAQLFYTRSPPSTVARTVCVPIRITAGATAMSRAVQVRVRVSDGATYGYDVEVRATQTELQLYDLGGTTARATVSAGVAAGVEVLLTLDDDAGTCAAYYRVATATSHDARAWAVVGVGQTATDDAGAGGGSLVQWGLRTTDTVTALYGPVRCSGSVWYVGGVSRPADLWPAYYQPTPGYVAAGCYVAASGGPAVVDDAYLVYGDAGLPARDALPWGDDASPARIRGGDRPSPTPLSGWRGSVTAGVLAFRPVLGLSGRKLDSGVIVLHLERPNFRTVALQIDTGAGLSTVATLDAATGATSLPFTRGGSRLSVDTGGSFGDEPLFDRSELVGGYVLLPGPVARPIVGNGGGHWSADDTDRRPWIDLDPDSITGAEASSGVLDVIYPRATLVVWTGALAVTRWALYWSSAPTTYEGYLAAAKIAFGAPVVPGILPDWGSEHGFAPGSEITELLDGQTIPAHLRDPRRILRVAYTVPGVAPDGAPLITYRGTTTGGALPIAVAGSHVGDVLGALLESDGAGRPVVYVPRAPSGTPDAYTLVGREAALYGRVMGEEHIGTLRWSDTTGDERVFEIGALDLRAEL